MFGKNKVMRPDEQQTGESLHVVEGSPFYTIQGEGPFMGHPAIFIRLHGCMLRCFFCDTDFSNPEDPTCSVGELTGAALALLPEGLRPKDVIVVLTGGEPARQPLQPLISTLFMNGFNTIQIETAGLYWQDVFAQRNVHIVVSPKTPKIHDMIGKFAVCFKYVLRYGDVSEEDGLPNKSTQIEGQTSLLARPYKHGTLSPRVYVSPMDEQDEIRNALNRKCVGETALKFGYRAQLQMHKFLDLP